MPGNTVSVTLAALAALGASAAAAASASARVPGRRRAARVGRRFFNMVSEEDREAQAAEAAEKAAEEEAERIYQEYVSARDALGLPNAIPFLGAPAYRGFMCNVAGDSGFDPLNFCKDGQDYVFQRKAELTHGRFAMLAALGWPLSEILQPELASEWGLPNLLASGGRAPSVLNGGLSIFDTAGITSIGVLFTVGFAMALIIENSEGQKAFDPLKLEEFSPPVISGMLPEGRKWMAEAELKNGRVAMLAITAYAATEFLTQLPVIEETPYLFFFPEF